MGNSVVVKRKGDRHGVREAFDSCGPYTAIIINCTTGDVVAEKISPAGRGADLNRLKQYARRNLCD